eukprot:UN30564
MKEDIFETNPFGDPEEPTLVQWKKNQFHLCAKNYEEELGDLQNEVSHFRNVKEQRIKRIAKTINVELTDDQLEQYAEEPKKCLKWFNLRCMYRKKFWRDLLT